MRTNTVSDNILDPNETFNLKASLESGTNTVEDTAQATITDGPVIVVGDPATGVGDIVVKEGEAAVFAVTVSNAEANSVLTLTLTGNTATDAVDFNTTTYEYRIGSGAWTTVPGTGEIPLAAAGNHSLQVRTNTVSDNILDPNETFNLKASLESGTNTVEDTAQATITDGPVITVSSETVSEEGLPLAIADTTGSPDTTNLATKTGNITISNVDSTDFAVVLTGSDVVTSGGETVIWTWSAGSKELIGSTTSGKEVVIIALGAQTDIGTTHNIAYTVTLKAPIDHPDNNVEDVLDLHFKFSVTETDGVTVEKDFSVKIEDDMPVALNTTQQFPGPSVDTNLMVILDLSGSMSTRIVLAKEAINNLIDSYDGLGDVKVHVVTFSYTAETNPGGLWMSATAAKSYIDALGTGGGTNYDAALAVAMEAFDAGNNSISGAQNISYFLSDGEPTRSDGNKDKLENINAGSGHDDDEGIQVAEEVIWIDFLKANDINSFALGIGSNITSSELYPIAYSPINDIAYDPLNDTDDNSNVIMVTNINDLDAALNNTVVPFVTGNIFSDPNSNIETGFGADGGYVFSVTLDVLVSGNSTSVTFTYDIAGDKITNNSGVLSEILDSAMLKVATEEGEFILNMDNGEYQYQLAAFNGHVDDLISYRLIDNDLDYADGSMALIIGTPPPPGIIGAEIDVDTYIYTYEVKKNGDVKVEIDNEHVHAYDKLNDGAYGGIVDAFNFVPKNNKDLNEITDASTDYFVLVVVNGHRNGGTNIVINNTATDAYLYGTDDSTGVKGYDNQVYTLDSNNLSANVKLLTGLHISFDENALLIPNADGSYPVLADKNDDYPASNLTYGIRMTETGKVKDGDHGDPSFANEHRNGALSVMAVKVTADGSGGFHDPVFTYVDTTTNSSITPHIYGVERTADSELLWETTVFAHESGDDLRNEAEYIANDALQNGITSGIFVDGIVEGLAYVTSSGFSGITDASGGFKYIDGDLITFSIGNVVIGTVSSAAMADGILFLQEIAGVGLEDMNNDYVENMAVLLQSLDNDADAYNGIVIEQSVHDALSDDNIDLATVSKTDLQSLLVDNGYQPVAEDAAMQHVRDMIELQTGMTEFDERISATSSSPTEEYNSVLTGTSGGDLLFSGLGEDSMPGAAGADIFIFSRDDIGESVETDTILDFNRAEGDKIDLADLLIAENLDNLDQYLSFEKSGADTLIHVKSDAMGAADHIIKLADVDLFTKAGGGNYSQSEILDNLKDDLIIDH